jgi:hypothetical protein
MYSRTPMSSRVTGTMILSRLIASCRLPNSPTHSRRWPRAPGPHRLPFSEPLIAISGQLEAKTSIARLTRLFLVPSTAQLLAYRLPPIASSSPRASGAVGARPLSPHRLNTSNVPLRADRQAQPEVRRGDGISDAQSRRQGPAHAHLRSGWNPLVHRAAGQHGGPSRPCAGGSARMT